MPLGKEYNTMLEFQTKRTGTTHPLFCGQEFLRAGIAAEVINDADRQKLQNIIKEKCWKSRTAFEKYLIHHGVIILLPSGRVEWVSETFESLTGYEAHEITGRIPLFLLNKYRRKPGIQKIMEGIREHKKITTSVSIRRSNGESNSVSLKLFPVFDHHNKPVAFLMAVARHRDNE